MLKFHKEINLFLSFFKRLRPFFKTEVAILGLNGIGILLVLAMPYLTRFIIDETFMKHNLRLFGLSALVGGGIFVAHTGIAAVKKFLVSLVMTKFSFALNKEVLQKCNKLDLTYFNDMATGVGMYRIMHSIDHVTHLVSTVPIECVLLIMRFALTIIMVGLLSWHMLVFGVIFAPLLFFMSLYFSKKRQSLQADLTVNAEDRYVLLEEFFSHIYVIKAFHKGAFFVYRYLRCLNQHIRLSLANVRLGIMDSTIKESMEKILTGCIGFYGGYQVIKGQMTLGTFTAIMIYLRQLVSMQVHGVSLFQTIFIGAVACERVARILSAPAGESDSPAACAFQIAKGTIAFHNVSFGYHQNKLVIQDLIMTITPGSYNALVGLSGCGKTTLINLILRLYTPLSGEIFIDDIPTTAFTLRSLRDQIGVVLQNPFLVNDTIEHNICYGRREVTRDEIERIACLCCLDEVIASFSDGMLTVVGENACRLSEGQKQRIAIARALIKNPKILILDEAMSAVDQKTEECIIKNIHRVFPEMHVLIISHRLPTIMQANTVYYLRSPREMRIGSPDHLINTCPDFLQLIAAHK